MIISHDLKTLCIGVPKNGSQTARAVLGQLGVDLVGEMGRHPKVPEAIRLAEALFPGEVIAPTAIYAVWRDPVERFRSAVEFHKRCLPNSFIELFPERFADIKPHPTWFEANPGAVAPDFRVLIEAISPLDILTVLSPPAVPSAFSQQRGDYLSFYRPQSEWLDKLGVTILPFVEYEAGIREVFDTFGGDVSSVYIPKINSAAKSLPILSRLEEKLVSAYYMIDFSLY